MTLPASGAINSEQIADELMQNQRGTFTVPNGVRTLCRKPSGNIIWPNDFHGEATHPNVISVLRFGAPSPGNTFTVPASAAVGDLLIVHQLAESLELASPSDVTPSGWTAFTGRSTSQTAEGFGLSTKGWFRLCTATTASDVITIMNGSSKNRICAILIKFDKTVGSAVLIDAIQVIGLGALTTSPTNMTYVTQLAGTHVVFGGAHGETSMNDADFVWNVAPIGAPRQAGNSPKGSASVTRTYYSAYDNNQTVPSPIRMDMTDQGTFNSIGGCIIRIRN